MILMPSSFHVIEFNIYCCSIVPIYNKNPRMATLFIISLSLNSCRNRINKCFQFLKQTMALIGQRMFYQLDKSGSSHFLMDYLTLWINHFNNLSHTQKIYIRNKYFAIYFLRFTFL